MKFRVFTVAMLLATVAIFGLMGRTSADDASKKDIVVTAVEADGFKTLVAAIKAAELVDTLKGEGPFISA